MVTKEAVDILLVDDQPVAPADLRGDPGRRSATGS